MYVLFSTPLGIGCEGEARHSGAGTHTDLVASHWSTWTLQGVAVQTSMMSH